MKGYFLISTDDWFIAPDGQRYKAVWGYAKIKKDDLLGIKANSRSANWFIMVGDKGSRVIVAGCQVHYVIECDYMPSQNACVTYNDKGEKIYTPCRIYMASTECTS